jgi:hypothetical protein
MTVEYVSRLPYETIFLDRQAFCFSQFQAILEEVAAHVNKTSKNAI